jgi:hypothetical protein
VLFGLWDHRRTGTRGMMDRKLGAMAKGDLDAVDNGLRRPLAL